MRSFIKTVSTLALCVSLSGCLVLMNANSPPGVAPSISPSTNTVAVGNSFSFTASGGSAPYTYSITSGLGSINAESGMFTAGGSAGTVEVKVTGADGSSSTALVTVNAALTISPASTTVYSGDTKTFTSTGGVGTATYSVVSGGISLSGAVMSRDWTNGAAVVRATDSIGNTSDSTVTLSSAFIQTGSTLSESYKAIVRNPSGGYFAVGDVVNGTGSSTTYEGVSLDTGTHVFVTSYTEKGVKGSTVILSSGAGKVDTVAGAAWDSNDSRIVVVGNTNGVGKTAMVGTQDFFITTLSVDLAVNHLVQQGAAGKDTGAQGVAVDSSGNIAVVGWSKGAFQSANAGAEDAIISVVSKMGVSTWKKQFGTVSADKISAVVVSGTSIYVSGSSDCNAITISHKNQYPAGPKLIAALTHLLQPSAAPAGIAPGCVAGLTVAFVAKYAIADGTKAWSPFQSGTLPLAMTGVALDSSSNLYAVGATAGKLGALAAPSAGNDSMAIMKFNSSGTHQFNAITGVSGSLTQPKGLTTASTGEIIVAGLTNGALGVGATGGRDAFVAQIKGSDGSNAWTLQTGTANDDMAYAITPGSAGTVVVAGGTNGSLPQRTNAGVSDAWLLKVTAAGVAH